MGIKVVAIHTDFRIYWPARFNALYSFLKLKGISLDVIEIAGKGSNYSFASSNATQPSYWKILFPESSPEELTGNSIKKKLFCELDNINPDIVIAGAIAFPSGALAVSWGQKHKKRVVIFDDAKMEAVRRNAIVDFIKKKVYHGVDAMLYPAPDWNTTGLYWGFSTEQIFYGIDVVDNAFWEKSREIRQDYGEYFVAVGRQIPKKNYLTLLRAYNIYQKAVGGKGYRLLLIGNGPEHQAILDYISQNDLVDLVTCLPFLSQDELAAIFQNAKGLVCCSNCQETWGLVINEAMACGCPIIASVESGATNTLVQDGVNGYKFSCDDTAALADRMKRLHCLDNNDFQNMRDASKRIIKGWDLDRFCKGVYDAIIYVFNQTKRKTSPTDRLIINSWKGRYRPT